LIIVLDNQTTAMTGHQLNPGMGEDGIKIENIVSACGVKNLKVIDPVNTKEFEEGLREFLDKEGVSVIIARHKCALLVKKQQG
jgi:indolepyruvate ferredoxin oxidoreductase alpha subunit